MHVNTSHDYSQLVARVCDSSHLAVSAGLIMPVADKTTGGHLGLDRPADLQ